MAQTVLLRIVSFDFTNIRVNYSSRNVYQTQTLLGGGLNSKDYGWHRNILNNVSSPAYTSIYISRACIVSRIDVIGSHSTVNVRHM